jgi:predicted lipid-binding transport protein (Tim44 family)
MNSSIIQLLVLAGIAIFLILRLRSVLGTREGFEKPAITTAPEAKKHKRPDLEVIEGGPDRDITDHVADGTDAARALAAMKGVDNSFNVREFLQGARGAYEMILMAFERGDMSSVKAFIAPEVYDAMIGVVAEREKNGLKVEATFVGISDLALKDATFDRQSREAEVAVRFVGELTEVVKNARGEVVSGSANTIKKQKDVWTFSRTMGSADPNWLLVATSE